jgi:hypothetical protein
MEEGEDEAQHVFNEEPQPFEHELNAEYEAEQQQQAGRYLFLSLCCHA